MARWTDERVWDAVDDWRWVPPGAVSEHTPEWDLVVTPGSYALTSAYRFRVEDEREVDARLESLRARILELGGTGVRLQYTPRTRPVDLPDRLARLGYRPREEAEVLVFELRGEDGAPRLPESRTAPGIEVREVLTVEEYAVFARLGTEIFGDPVPPPEIQEEFLSAFRERVGREGRSDRFLAWDGPTAIGRAGLEVAGPVGRLWGTGVLLAHRRRGAYGAMVTARCRSSFERGAEIALVTARTGTSGPILRRAGFRWVGRLTVWEARW